MTTSAMGKRGEEGVGANRRTAEMAGGGAVLGTLIGAVAGGGKDAAIGAIAGAAARHASDPVADYMLLDPHGFRVWRP